ncbi:tyrosine-protein phosphatase [Thalassobacillus hwangdonensis]|uniref:Tyrosine-protein phosphatase n=1 Tax=Thalassobacillus hwangdonensis TaxID=546108 RepID=A0ABW3L2G2_9BACI
MIDLHSHILPGVDDGAKTLEDSLAMAEAAVQDGIDTIIATPHHQNGKYINEAPTILNAVHNLNEALQSNQIPLKVLPGQETRIHGSMVEALEEGTILPLNEDTGYVFVELPSDQVPRYTKQVLFDIQMKGYKPIIVHPERNAKLIQEPDLLYQFVQNGAYTQITAASLCGRFGKNIQTFTHQLIEANLTHLIASDAHNTTSRGFCVREAYQEVQENYGASMVYFFDENAKFVAGGQNLAADPPEQIRKKKKFLGIF